MKSPEKFDQAQWILGLNLAWISSADSKVGAVTAIDLAMFSALGFALGSTKLSTRSCPELLAVGFTVLFLLIALFCCAMAMSPRTSGPANSFIFFSHIARRKREQYHLDFASATDEELMADLLAQVHRNAEIADRKFYWVKRGVMFSFAASIPWGIAIWLLTK